ncbi:hypothetical protein P4050_00545 [Pseudomonas aeruginosa]|nr:hypothetical protein [Pseudomonas aeruginosa]
MPRSGASVVFGLVSVVARDGERCGLPVAAALGSVVACLGADVASGSITCGWRVRLGGMMEQALRKARSPFPARCGYGLLRCCPRQAARQ